MYHPFIDVKSLTDDEILNRLNRCTNVINYANTYGQSALYQSAILQYHAYQAEWEERLERKRFDEYKEKSPDGVLDIGSIEEIENKEAENGESNN